MLMPLPKKGPAKGSSTEAPAIKEKPEPSTKKKLDTKKTRANATNLKKLRRAPMPKQLVGGVPCDDEGNPFCFAFNLGTCKSSGDCPKGAHTCCKKGCGKRHSFISAHKQTA